MIFLNLRFVKTSFSISSLWTFAGSYSLAQEIVTFDWVIAGGMDKLDDVDNALSNSLQKFAISVFFFEFEIYKNIIFHFSMPYNLIQRATTMTFIIQWSKLLWSELEKWISGCKIVIFLLLSIFLCILWIFIFYSVVFMPFFKVVVFFSDVLALIFFELKKIDSV